MRVMIRGSPCDGGLLGKNRGLNTKLGLGEICLCFTKMKISCFS